MVVAANSGLWRSEKRVYLLVPVFRHWQFMVGPSRKSRQSETRVTSEAHCTQGETKSLGLCQRLNVDQVDSVTTTLSGPDYQFQLL